MHRYIAFVWDSKNTAAQDRVEGFLQRLSVVLPQAQRALDRPGLVICAATDSPAKCDIYKGEFPVQGRADVVVIGGLFKRDVDESGGSSRAVLDEATRNAIVRTKGRVLLDRFWGTYVAFIHDATAESTFIVRDPSADMPCWMLRSEQVTVVFSCMEDALALEIGNLSFNWRYLAAFIVRPYLPVRQTGLNEVTAVTPGECVELRSGVETKRYCYWDIVGIAADQPIEDVSVAAALARQTIYACAGALAAGHDHIIHHLSGGLDSSAVLAALLRAPSRTRVTCIHHCESGAGADERRYARLAVEGASASFSRDCELLELKRDPAKLRFDRGGPFPRSPWPARYVGYIITQTRTSTFAGPTVQCTGNGGDAVFGRFEHNYAAIDYAWRHGLDPRLLRIAFEAAQGRDTFYEVLAAAIHRGLIKRDRAVHTFKVAPMVHPDVLDAASRDFENLLPTWFRASNGIDRLSPEKIKHIEAMTVPWQPLDPYEGTGLVHWISPLTTQPVMELFARMPFYVLMAGAEERTVTRRAFAQDLPARLLARRTKSYFTDYMLTAVRQNEGFLREIFLDGILVRERIVDRRILEKTFSTLQTDCYNPTIRALFGPMLNVELWYRAWSDGQLATTAAAA